MKPLSPRQHDVAAAISRGLSNKAIAAELGLSLGTIKTHVAETLDRLGVRSRVEVATLIVRGQVRRT